MPHSSIDPQHVQHVTDAAIKPYEIILIIAKLVGLLGIVVGVTFAIWVDIKLAVKISMTAAVAYILLFELFGWIRNQIRKGAEATSQHSTQSAPLQ